MYSYRINQHLIVLKSDSVSINKSIALEFVTVKVSQEFKLDVKYVNTVKSTT